MIQPGQAAPDFQLRDLDGIPHRLSAQKGRVTVLHIWSSTCPWTERTDPRVREAASAHGADLWTIAPNTDETEDQLRTESRRRGLRLVLRDVRQQVADLYGVTATPHVVLVDARGLVRYHGAVDDARFREPQPRRRFLAEALAAIQRGEDPDPAATPTYGCAIVREA
ncbi:MAG TPA: redoxin domain-containing protein [Anaerolineales bacterium]|nr:redoxin domain-containing protein [Anaerolineales bacterium]